MSNNWFDFAHPVYTIASIVWICFTCMNMEESISVFIMLLSIFGYIHSLLILYFIPFCTCNCCNGNNKKFVIEESTALPITIPKVPTKNKDIEVEKVGNNKLPSYNHKTRVDYNYDNYYKYNEEDDEEEEEEEEEEETQQLILNNNRSKSYNKSIKKIETSRSKSVNNINNSIVSKKIKKSVVPLSIPEESGSEISLDDVFEDSKPLSTIFEEKSSLTPSPNPYIVFIIYLEFLY